MYVEKNPLHFNTFLPTKQILNQMELIANYKQMNGRFNHKR